MKRRAFLKSLIAVPVVGMAALAIPTPAPTVLHYVISCKVEDNIFSGFKVGDPIYIKGGTYSPLTAKDLLKEWPPSSP